MKKKNAFTLIELIAVLVILAVIALIVTPLVMNIIKKAKDSANKRSVDAYGKATELAVATYLLDNGDYPTTIDDLTIEYSENEVVCNVKTLNEDGSIYLSECTVNGNEVKDAKTDDGWYHYGKTTTVTYDAYSIGDVVTYNGISFYVIANSDESSDYVTLLKAEPLTLDEVNTYGVGHINNYTNESVGTAYDVNNYGAVAYYSSATCGFADASSDSYVTTGCSSNYETSDVKYIVDNFSNAKFSSEDLKEDELGYKIRLITIDELTTNLGYELDETATSESYNTTESTPSWIYNSNYSYWTMSSYSDSIYNIRVLESGDLDSGGFNNGGFITNASATIRPVVTLYKSAI